MQNSAKILFVSENAHWGGSELLWTKTVVELISKNMEIMVCVSPKLELPKWFLEYETQNKFEIKRLSTSKLSKVNSILNRFLPYKFQFKATNIRNQFVLDYQPDLVVINQGYNFNSVAFMAICNQSKLKYVTISHAVNESFWPDLNLRKKMILGFNKSQQNYFVSQDNLTVTQSQLGCALKNSQVIRNPFNVPFDINLEYPKNKNFQLACVGRLDFKSKGQDILLRVLALEKWKTRNIVVNFYGEGEDLENLKDLIYFYKIKNAFIHHHQETSKIWEHNQALILTSRFEGLPIVLVEAMLCNRFGIMTNVSGNRELITDNIDGFIAQAPRIEYVDQALERAWSNKDQWEKIGKLARINLLKKIPQNPALEFSNELFDVLTNL